MTDFYVLLIVWIVCGIAAGLIWQSKGGPLSYGFVMGVLLGPLGVLAALLMKPKEAAEKAAEPCPERDSFGQPCVLPSGHRQPHAVRQP